MAFAAGGYDRYVVTPARQAMRVPDALGLEHAVTVPIAFLTAAYTLDHCAKLGAGEKVLIHAATGGVGMAAVQLAQAAGAEIYATAGSPQKRALLRSLGVPHVYDSRSVDFADEILRDTSGSGVDVVLNSLADEFVDRTFDVVADGGRFIEIGKRGIWPPERVARLPKRVVYHVVDWGVTAREQPDVIHELFASITKRLECGDLRPLPHRSFPIARIKDAFRYMAQGKHIGKIVVVHARQREPAIVADGTYLIAGGLSGLGLRTARWLADKGAKSVALIGRTAPQQEAETTLAELRARGVDVTVGTLDIADRPSLDRFLAALRARGLALRGVVQSTGVLDDGVLLKQRWSRFRKVFTPKVDGTQNLHELTATDSLDFFVLFSSLASLIGSAGQANHAAANAFLDAFAAARRAAGRPAVSVNWGPWSQTGAAVRHGVIERGAARGLFAISPDEGFAALDVILASGATQVGVANIDWTAFLGDQQPTPRFFDLLHTHAVEERDKVRDDGAAEVGWLERVGGLPAARQRTEVLRFVRTEVGRLLGLGAGDVETDRPLSEMGLDSLLAVEIRNVLGKVFGLSLPATLTFDHPSIDALTAYLWVQKFARSDIQRTPESRTPADAVAGIEDLSDDDVDRLIAARLKT
jgi:NADPH:quinone reductase-like Zn-dependent oxidoreductase